MRVLLSFHINSLSPEPSLRISLKRRKTIPWIRNRKYQAVVFLPKICFHLSLSQQSRNGTGSKELFCFPIPAQTDFLKFMAQHPKSVSALVPLGNVGAAPQTVPSSVLWGIPGVCPARLCTGLGMILPPPEPVTPGSVFLRHLCMFLLWF